MIKTRGQAALCGTAGLAVQERGGGCSWRGSGTELSGTGPRVTKAPKLRLAFFSTTVTTRLLTPVLSLWSHHESRKACLTITILPVFPRLPLLRASPGSDESRSKNNVFFLNILHAAAFKLFQLKVGEERGSRMEEILLRSGMAHEGDATLNAGAGLPHAFADAQDDSLSTCAHVFSQLFCLP